MKLRLVVVVSLLLASSNFARADQPTRSHNPPAGPALVHPASTAAPVKVAPRQEVATLTGSHLKRDVRKDYLGHGPLYVLDGDTIRNSGAVDLHDLLTRRGARR